MTKHQRKLLTFAELYLSGMKAHAMAFAEDNGLV